MGFEIASDYTRTTTTNTLINVKLGDPKAKLYYSDPEYFIGDYGYVWLTMIDMPTFSGLNLRLSWVNYYHLYYWDHHQWFQLKIVGDQTLLGQ